MIGKPLSRMMERAKPRTGWRKALLGQPEAYTKRQQMAEKLRGVRKEDNGHKRARVELAKERGLKEGVQKVMSESGADEFPFGAILKGGLLGGVMSARYGSMQMAREAARGEE